MRDADEFMVSALSWGVCWRLELSGQAFLAVNDFVPLRRHLSLSFSTSIILVGTDVDVGQGVIHMSRFTAFALACAVSVLSSVGAAHAAEKCYKDVAVAAKIACTNSNSVSADFTNGCKFVAAHVEKQEIACPVGKWVNVTADTKMGKKGALVSQAQVCAQAGLVPYNINGKICASGERPARVGNGWQSIVYKYGLKGGGNGGDGGDRIQTFNSPGNHSTQIGRRSGTMCYDYNMGEKNNTSQDALVAVYCK
ncbi:hypothetical protein HFO56_33480 [Rhizobium laguerreae]|uniref:hypothetical protein n=1 Tax=Rhizobium laguerreae TaxID=1076926 RepID=UPI001C90CD2F|nr:hypothetical protein [Rhizobium laguerreae]MBY3157239.1 hypothetical protein [Rhizobium laguerreae]